MSFLVELLSNLRLYQFYRMLLKPLTVSDTKKIIHEVRVPPEQYRNNLLSMIHTFRKNGTSIILMTSPTAFYEKGVPNELVKQNLTLSKEAALNMHKQYNEIVREVAEQESIILVDLETEFNTSSMLEQLFKADGIHFSKAGLYVVSERLCLALEDILVLNDT